MKLNAKSLAWENLRTVGPDADLDLFICVLDLLERPLSARRDLFARGNEMQRAFNARCTLSVMK